MKKLLLILLCLPIIGFGKELPKDKKRPKCVITGGGIIYLVENGISGILEGKYIPQQVDLSFFLGKRVDAVEFYLRNIITNEKSLIQKVEATRLDRKFSKSIRLESPITDVLHFNEYNKDSDPAIEIYFRSSCYNGKYDSEWFVEDFTLDFRKNYKKSDIERILHYYCYDDFEIDIHNSDFDVRSYFYDTTFIKEKHITYTTAPTSSYNAIATIESKSKQEGLLGILKDIGLDVIYKKETRRKPIHITPTTTLPSYTAPTTHIETSPGVVESYPGKTYGGGTIGGQTYGGEEYDIYTYTLIESKRIEEEISKKSKYDILMQLSKLKDQGVLTEEEFTREKEKILNQD